jgi:alanyl-tRNA synthetase
LGSVNDGKVALAVKVSKDLVDKKVHAGVIVKEAAAVVGGGGGGKPEFAQAGGKDPAKLDQALAAASALARQALAH